MSIRPFFDFGRTHGAAPFPFQAPDESLGFAVWDRAGFAVGPAIGFEGSRTARRVGAQLPKVDATVEVGGFIQYQLAKHVRLRTEARRGVNGHKGWVGTVGADYVTRDEDAWLFSIGPRLTLSDGRYQDAYFTVTPADGVSAGLATFDAEGGIHAVGVTAGFLRQLTPRWGVATFARYDRLVRDAAASPIVRRLGSRDQMSGGVAATYTFGHRPE